MTNSNTSAGRTVTIGNDLTIGGGSQAWSAPNGSAITLVTGNLSGSGTIALDGPTLQASGDGGLSVWRLSGSNSGYTGTLYMINQRRALALMNPGAQTGGNIDLGRGAFHGSNTDRRFLYLSGSTAMDPFTFGVGNGAGQVSFNTKGNTSGGILHDGEQWLRLGGPGDYTWSRSTFYVEGRVSSSTGALQLGDAADKLILAGSFDSNVKTLKVDGSGTVNMLYGLDDTGLSGRTLRKIGSGVLVLNSPSSGAQTTITDVNGGDVIVSNMNQIFDGNLNLSSTGTLISDGVDGPAFVANRSSGLGTGASQWRVTGGGLAARGVDVVIPASVGTIASNFRIGSSLRETGNVLFADNRVLIEADVSVAGGRTITLRGGNSESTTGWTLNSPVHEISGKITGTGNLQFAGTGRQSAVSGTVRLTNAGNDFVGQFNVCTGSTEGSPVVIVTDVGCFGASGNAVQVGQGSNGSGGLLLFENTGAGSKTFARDFLVGLDSNPSSGDAGFGVWGGDVTYSGTITIGLATNNRDSIPVEVHNSGVLRFASGSTIENNSTSGSIFQYRKNGDGELDLANMTLTRSAGAMTSCWTLDRGTITSHAPAQLQGTSPDFRLDRIIGSTTTTFPVRQLNIRGVDHIYTGITPTATHTGDITIDVPTGLTFGTEMASGALMRNAEVGASVSGLTFGITKTGGGTWYYRSSQTSASGTGRFNGFLRVNEGTLDLNGDLGRTGLWANGGTLLVGNSTALSFGSSTNTGRVHVTGSGSRIGISPAATGDVTRPSSQSWDGTNNVWDPTGTVTLAARDNYNLIWNMTAFPTIASGVTLLIERDGTGTGEVRFADSTIDVDGTLSGSGSLRTGGGTGLVTVTGELAPGSGVGGLTIAGNVSLGSASVSTFELPAAGTAGVDYDTVNLTGSLTIASGAVLETTGITAMGL